MGNLRQKVHEELHKHGTSCKCIRCREAGLNKKEFSQTSNLKELIMMHVEEKRFSCHLMMKMI